MEGERSVFETACCCFYLFKLVDYHIQMSAWGLFQRYVRASWRQDDLDLTWTKEVKLAIPCISCSIFYLLPGTLYLYLVTLTSYLLPSLPPLPSYPLSFFLPSTFPLPSAIYLPSTFYLLLPLLPSLTFCPLPSAFYLLPSAIFTFYRLPVTFLTIFYLSPSALPLTCPTVVGNE